MCVSLSDHVRSAVARMDASHCSGPTWSATEYLDTTGLLDFASREQACPSAVLFSNQGRLIRQVEGSDRPRRFAWSAPRPSAM
ncbi:MAG: hypothetical protein ACI841_002853 [Planctomycetota bacterium]|jgi:hypothetical protein